MSKKLVLDVGNCSPDHASIRRMIESRFDAEVVQCHGLEDAMEVLRSRPVALVTINRKLDRDYSDGTEILKQIKADPEIGHVPVMLVTNYSEHQDAAVALGAERGFGKLQLTDAETHRKLAKFLGEPRAV